jgi:hypothetical protein
MRYPLPIESETVRVRGGCKAALPRIAAAGKWSEGSVVVALWHCRVREAHSSDEQRVHLQAADAGSAYRQHGERQPPDAWYLNR